MARLIILGTGTGIGKTYVSCALARALARVLPGRAICAFKPIESGIRPTSQGRIPEDADAALLAQASAPRFDAPVPPYWLSTPVSPHLAARRNGLSIDLETVSAWCDEVERNAIRDAAIHYACGQAELASRSVSLFESAGATFSPVTDTATNFDLARSLGPSIWVLVAPDRLGVLHDVTTTLECMKARGRNPDFLLLSRSDPNDTSAGTNQIELQRLGIAHVHAVVPYQGELEDRAANEIASRLSSMGGE